MEHGFDSRRRYQGKAGAFLFFYLGCMLFWLVHMPLTHCFFRTPVPIPVGTTKDDIKACAFLFLCLGVCLFGLGHMPLTHCFFRTRVSIPVDTTKERLVPFFFYLGCMPFGVRTHASHSFSSLLFLLFSFYFLLFHLFPLPRHRLRRCHSLFGEGEFYKCLVD